MYDEKANRLYVDFTTLSRFRACKELSRLGAWRPNHAKASLSFGHAIHAGIAGLYDAQAGWKHDINGKLVKIDESIDPAMAPVQWAKRAFLLDLKFNNAELPVDLDNAERRSVERGLALIDAYVWHWRGELYENILDATGRPLTEVGFAYHLTNWLGTEVWYVGYIDRIMRSMLTHRAVIFETKTTTQALSMYLEHREPNHQVTGYFPHAFTIDPTIKEAVWDCIFISDRRPDLDKSVKDKFMAFGVDSDKDFGRAPTKRSMKSIEEWRDDIIEDILDYAQWYFSDRSRWPRNDGSCHSYGGCMFRKRCCLNLTPSEEIDFLKNDFKKEPWEPWRRIVLGEE